MELVEDMELMGTLTAINTLIVTIIGVFMAVGGILITILIYRLNKTMTRGEIEAKLETKDKELESIKERLSILENREYKPKKQEYHLPV